MATRCAFVFILCMGDGIGKDTHLSLFFVVMHGEFDNILQWLFIHKVTFKFINQAASTRPYDRERYEHSQWMSLICIPMIPYCFYVLYTVPIAGQLSVVAQLNYTDFILYI